jgi:demethylmenaquinone methyltransferase/2-methoxy-6-polyprenyl-1,4-benzoquinol methylase
MDEYYTEIASGYDALHGEEQDRKLRQFLERVRLREGLVVLDVGCGTGRSAAMLALYDAHWHGIDPSSGLLAYARMQKGKAVQGMAEAMPYPDASFDVVISLTALQNFIDPIKGLKEMRRVAKPGAIFFISFLKKAAKHEELDTAIRSLYAVEEHWEEPQDRMYICR